MDMERMAKFEALQNNANFEQELSMVNTAEEMQRLFSNYGIEMSLEEVRDMVLQASKLNNDELTADDLESVAGGAWYIVAGKWVLKTVAAWFLKKGLDKLTGW